MKEAELLAYLAEKRRVNSEQARVTPLSGGVSCEILLIDDGDTRFVLKQALEKLKVKDEWFADVKRNQTEQRYLTYVAAFLPDVVPSILYSDAEHHFFCMEMLDNGLKNWKELLLNTHYHRAYAQTAGRVLATIHAASAGDPVAQKDFDTLSNFHELRIEPYLLRTGERHPECAHYFLEEAERLRLQKTCLVHGDFSPKNILVNPERFVVLDCEVAWYGDPIFDIAFFLNHFMLKALYRPHDAETLIQLARIAWESYTRHAKELIHKQFESQFTHLLCMLLLARVDGKSPVEYLNAEQQQTVREFVYRELPRSSNNFETLTVNWLQTVQKL